MKFDVNEADVLEEKKKSAMDYLAFLQSEMGKEAPRMLLNSNFDFQLVDDGDVYFSAARMEAIRNWKKRQAEAEEREQQIEQQQKRLEQNRGKLFVKCFVDGVKDISKTDLTPTYLGHFMKLTMLLDFDEENYLYNGGKKMSKADLRSYLTLNKLPGDAFIGKVVELKLLQEHKPKKNGLPKHYSINPNLHLIGKDLEKKEHVKLYKKTFKEMTTMLTTSQIGILYKIIPYFHMNKYFLAKNPNCREVEQAQPFTKKTELAKVISVSTKTLTRAIKAFKEVGIMMEFHTFGIKMLYIHPNLIFKKDIDDDEKYTNYILSLFEQMQHFSTYKEEESDLLNEE